MGLVQVVKEPGCGAVVGQSIREKCTACVKRLVTDGLWGLGRLYLYVRGLRGLLNSTNTFERPRLPRAS